MTFEESTQNFESLVKKISPAFLLRLEVMIQGRARQAVKGYQGGMWHWVSPDYPALIIAEDREVSVAAGFRQLTCQFETVCWGLSLIMLSGLIGPEGSEVEVGVYEALYEAAIARATELGERELSALQEIID